MGLSFKAGTDDLRNSPTLNVIDKLLNDNYEILIYDKNVNEAKLMGSNKKFFEHEIPEISDLIINDISSLISNSELIVIANKEKEFENFLKNINDKTIVDLVYLGDSIRNKDNYFGLSW